MIVLDATIRGDKVKGIQIEKEVKLSLLADDMILYIKDPKDTNRKLLELINKFGNVAGSKLYTNLLHFSTLTTKDQK